MADEREDPHLLSNQQETALVPELVAVVADELSRGVVNLLGGRAASIQVYYTPDKLVAGSKKCQHQDQR
jgi:hypothetical protein